MLDNWTEALETGGQIDTIYTDYEKVFDKVPHKRLVKKIASFGLPQQIVRWIWKLFSVGDSTELK